jgi:hypothetical protein
MGSTATFIAMIAQCVPGRSHDHAAFCPSGVVAASCRADTALAATGTRTSGTVQIFFDTPDGSQLTASFDDSGALRAAVAAATQSHIPISVEMWQGEVWQADFGGRWALAADRPTYEVPATVAFSVFAGPLLVLCRLVLRGRATGRRDVGAWLRRAEGAGQALLLAAGIWWLESGSPWGVAALAADALWTAWLFVTSRPRRSGGRRPAKP